VVFGKCFNASRVRVINFQAESPEVTEYRPVAGTWDKFGEPIQLYTSVLGLKFQVGPKSFRQGVIKILCTAKIGQMSKELTTELVIRHQNYPDPYYGQKPNSAPPSKLISQHVLAENDS